MSLMNLSAVLAAVEAPAAPAGTQQQPPAFVGLVPMILIVVVFYFIFIRPQQKRAREQAEMIKSIKAGDKIVTSGGIVGVVVTVKEKSISLRSADSKMEITKNAVAEIVERSGESSSES